MRTRQKRVATDTWRSLGCRTTPLEPSILYLWLTDFERRILTYSSVLASESIRVHLQQRLRLTGNHFRHKHVYE